MDKILISLVVLLSLSTQVFAQDLSTRRPVRRTRTTRVRRPVPAPKAPKKDDKLFSKYIFNVGTHTEFYNNIQNDTSGGVRKFDISPTLGLGFFVPLESEITFLPEINWVLPQTVDGSKIIKNLFMFRADFGYDPVDWFRLRLGTSLMWLNQHGTGGSAEVNNGNSTSTFYYPDENRSSFNNTLDIGGEFLMDEWALRLQTYTYSVFKEQKRQISYSLFLTYYWDR